LRLPRIRSLAQNAARGFASGEARPAARAAEENGAFPEALLRRAWDLGLSQAAASGEPIEQPTVLNALVLEEIAYGDAALAVALGGALGFVRAIAEQGTGGQRERHFPAFQSEKPAFAAVATVEVSRHRTDDAGGESGKGLADRGREGARSARRTLRSVPGHRGDA
jgi:alkylation response protein AidB-like acyl-CoA dehydrogenase